MVLAWLLKIILITSHLVRAAAARDRNPEVKGHNQAVRDHNPDLEVRDQNSLEVRDPNQDQEAKGHNPDPEVRDQNSLEVRDLNRSVIRS